LLLELLMNVLADNVAAAAAATVEK